MIDPVVELYNRRIELEAVELAAYNRGDQIGAQVAEDELLRLDEELSGLIPITIRDVHIQIDEILLTTDGNTFCNAVIEKQRLLLRVLLWGFKHGVFGPRDVRQLRSIVALMQQEDPEHRATRLAARAYEFFATPRLVGLAVVAVAFKVASTLIAPASA